MDTDRNLLFAVLALQADVLDADQFVKVCTLWSSRKQVPIADLLIELGWITAFDRADVERLVHRKVKRHGGDPKAGLAAVANDLKRSLAAVQDEDIQRSLAELPAPDALTTTAPDAVMSHRDDRYTLTRLHASGGIGRVWLARDSEFGRNVALKELRPERADHATHRARFLQEAHITGQLEHPGIVPVYELVLQPKNQQPFYTMRFVKGRTLSEAAREYHRSPTTGSARLFGFVSLLSAFVTVCHTIAYAHSRGVIHRDLKGENVVLGDFGEVVVLDWGLAKLIDRPEAEADHAPIVIEDTTGSGLTVYGQAIGTPAYMAPEQASGLLSEIGCHTDIYGLGAILYEILTGRAPFSGADTFDVLRKVRQDPPIRPHEFWTDAPTALEDICLRALAKRPTDRFASATELAKAVEGWQETERREAQEERDRFFTLSLDMLCIAGFDGYFKRLNPAFGRTLGFTDDELLAKPYLSFIHPDDLEKTRAQAQGIAAGTDAVTFENRYRCKDGTYKWMLWTSTAYADRQLIYAAARDITARKVAEEALWKSQERYRSVIAAMQDGIVMMDADGTIRACNASAERILGLSADQMMGRTSLDPRWRAVHEDGTQFPGDMHPVMVTLRTGQACSNVIMGVHKPDGALTWISINSQPLFDADGLTPAGVVASFEDISDRKATEQALQTARLELARLQAMQQP
jgi:PAS domain S-box-containing protein